MGKTTVTVTGRLVHPNGDPGYSQNVKIFSCKKKVNGRQKKGKRIGHFTSDAEGKFEARFNRNSTDDSVIFRVYEETQPWAKNCLNVVCGCATGANLVERAVYETAVHLPKDMDSVNVGNLLFRLYEYQEGFPDLEQPKDESERPQQWPPAYYAQLVEDGFIPGVDDVVLTLEGKNVSPSRIEAVFGVLDKKLTLDSTADTIDMILNGIYPCQMLRGRNDNEFIIEIDLNMYEKAEGPVPMTPYCRATLERKDGKLDISEIYLKDKDDKFEKTYKFGGENFQEALFLFNCLCLMKGEIVSHLGIGHIVSGQYAMAAFRCIKTNPILHLLHPHLKGVLEINRLGASAIFGAHGVLAITGLSVKGIQQSLKDVLGGVCYSTFTPREPLVDNANFAKAENLYWYEVLTPVVDQFFEANQNEIINKWHEVYWMSKALVEHSVEYKPWDGHKYEDWADKNEIDDPNEPGRIEFDGVLRTIRPITSSLEAPGDGDMDRLKQFCKHAIFCVTFWHFAVHYSQGKWGTNLKFANLAPREPKEVSDQFDVIHLPYGNITAKDANHQMSVAEIFAKFIRDPLIQNKQGDIYKPLITLLKQKSPEFKALGYNIKDMPYGTNI